MTQIPHPHYFHSKHERNITPKCGINNHHNHQVHLTMKNKKKKGLIDCYDDGAIGPMATFSGRMGEWIWMRYLHYF